MSKRILCFDPHLASVVGGVPRLTATAAALLTERYEVTLLTPNNFSPQVLENLYGVHLGRVRFYPMPTSPALSIGKGGTSDLEISNLTREFDIFWNTGAGYWIPPQARRNLYYCNFPTVERWRSIKLAGRRLKLPLTAGNFFAHRYRIACNSEFTRCWIEKKWHLPAAVLYLFAAMQGPSLSKEKLILSVGRLDPVKRQDLVITCFRQLFERKALEDYRLLMVVGIDSAPHLEPLKQKIVDLAKGLPVEFIFDSDHETLKRLYARASIFWHLRGMGLSDDPLNVEHFGMVIVEAMQNGCVPVVFDAGGAPEIIPHQGIEGFRVCTPEEVVEVTQRLIRDAELRQTISSAAREASERFSLARFREQLFQFTEAL